MPARGADRSERAPLSLDKRKALTAIAFALLLAGGAYTAIGAFAHWPELRRALDRLDRVWIPLLLGGEVLAYAGYVLAYRDVARVGGGPRLRYWTIVRIVAIGFGAFVVGSAAGGLAVDYWALRRAGVRRHAAIRRVLALNTLEWAWLGAFAAVSGAVALALRRGNAPLYMSLAWLVVVPSCVIAALFVSEPDRGERFARQPRSPKHREGARFVRRMTAWLRTETRVLFADAVGGLLIVRQILSRPLRWPRGFIGYSVYWIGDLLTLYAGVRAFGHDLAPDLLVLAYASGYVITAFPLPAGGAGGVDAALALTLHIAGLPLASALLAVVAYRIFSFWLPILPALSLLPTVGHLNEELGHVAEASAG